MSRFARNRILWAACAATLPLSAHTAGTSSADQRDVFRIELESTEGVLVAGLRFGGSADGRVTRLEVTSIPHPDEVGRDVRFEKITRE